MVHTLKITGLGLILWMALPGMVRAEPTASDTQVPEPQPSVRSEKEGYQKSRSRTRKGRASSEKEAEGTQAPNRFGADIILKSKYELNGQSLEVDPD